jgi:hypothetical protein
MKYDHFSMLPERAFQPRNGRMNMTLEGGGGGGQTTSTVTQSNIPEWLRPQTEAVLGAGMQEYFETTPRELTKFKTETRVDEEGNTTEVQVPDGTEMAYDITVSSPIPLTVPIHLSTLLALPQVKSKSLARQPTFKRLAPLVQLVNSWELAAEGA